LYLGNGGHKKCVSVDTELTISLEGYKPFNFDYVADEEVPQGKIFEQIARPIADCCLEGYNGSIFAYG
jgi:Kinesin motor domain